jgi:hypothetical protein
MANNPQVGLRLSPQESRRLDEIVKKNPFATRHSVAKAALLRGLDAMEAETKSAAPTRAPACSR